MLDEEGCAVGSVILFEADDLVIEESTHEDLVALPSQRGITSDEPELEVAGILKGRGVVDIGPRGCTEE